MINKIYISNIYVFNKLNFYIQFKAPWFHSWINPIIKIIINNILVNNHIIIFDIFIEKIIGIINAISISKIKKIIVIRKNRIEKGIRLKYFGLNPHSNGDIFSKFIFIFIDTIIEIFIINIEININNILIINIK